MWVWGGRDASCYAFTQGSRPHRRLCHPAPAQAARAGRRVELTRQLSVPKGRGSRNTQGWLGVEPTERNWRKLNNDETKGQPPVTPAAALLFQAPKFEAPDTGDIAKPSREGGGGREGRDGRSDKASGRGRQRPNQGGGQQGRDSGASGQRGGRSGQKTDRSDGNADSAQNSPGSGPKKNSGDAQSKSRKTQEGTDESRQTQQRPAKGGTPKAGTENDSAKPADTAPSEDEKDDAGKQDGSTGKVRRRRRRPRSTGKTKQGGGDNLDDQVRGLKGSTRLEAKRMRRREGRREGRKRQSITEAEFLARRESVDRQMVVRHEDGADQVAVLEDGILVELFVARRTTQSIVGNIYLGKVQNVLPSMEAAFIDIGRGRNAVLYAGEVNWDVLGTEGKPRRIETALSPGDNVMVQVTKDPIGHKGARLTSQITLAGRYLVFVPGSSMLGISRKLPESERQRLKKLLRAIVPEHAGVIVRTAAEGATEEQLRADVERLEKQWASIQKKEKSSRKAPVLLRGEPELVVRVVRDLFNEDVSSLTVQGDETWQTVQEYVEELSPDLSGRLEHWTSKEDVFEAKRVKQQLAKGMDKKVWLPSGGTLVIERTEALTVIDVNTGKFVGSGGTLEETVTRNNLEAAEEIVRQLRLRDIGGIIIIDFVDMVLESNRELVMRRLTESLGRDRTRHQVTEVTSLGLVQMTRKRVGEGLVEAFSTTCEVCEGRGFIVHDHPVEISGKNSGQAQSRARRQQDRARVEPRREAQQDTHVGDEKVKSALSAIAAATVNGSDAEASPAPKADVPERAPAKKSGQKQERQPKKGPRRAQRKQAPAQRQEKEEHPAPVEAEQAADRGSQPPAHSLLDAPRAKAPSAKTASAKATSAKAPSAKAEPSARDKKAAETTSEAAAPPRTVEEITLPVRSQELQATKPTRPRRAVVTGPVDTSKFSRQRGKQAQTDGQSERKETEARQAVQDLFRTQSAE